MEGGREASYLWDKAGADDGAAFIRCVYGGTHKAAELNKALVLGFGIVTEDLLKPLLHDCGMGRKGERGGNGTEG